MTGLKLLLRQRNIDLCESVLEVIQCLCFNVGYGGSRKWSAKMYK